MEYLVVHLIGDFLLQNEWMQGKTGRWFPCLVHVTLYMIPWIFFGLPITALTLIAVEHAVQDRYRLNRYWMSWVKQIHPEKWPQGALWVDQSLHAAWIGLVFILFV